MCTLEEVAAHLNFNTEKHKIKDFGKAFSKATSVKNPKFVTIYFAIFNTP